MKNKPPPYLHPSLKGIKYVLFPRGRYVQHWDNFFLCVLLYYCFAIPYTVGVSGGYWMYNNTGWFVVNVLLNAVYVLDTIMQFFRAYYDENGVIVYELRRIAKHCVVSGQFFLNVLACFPPVQLILILTNKKYYENGVVQVVESSGINILVLVQLLRLLRIPRVKTLTQSSIAFQSFWERQDVSRVMLAAFMFKLVVVSHWIACFWSFIAFAQVWTFGNALGEEPNWISNWYESQYVEGGINPIGWGNDLDRYALSLFWAVQSVTSIGYGNVAPVTRLEYFFANILMLVSGLFWAFTIGNIVSIVDHMNSSRNQYKKNLDHSNQMIRCFTDTPQATTLIGSFTNTPEPDRPSEVGVGDAAVIGKRIRRFVTSQFEGRILNRPTECNSPNLDQVFPVLQGLPFELRRLSSLHLMRKYLEMIPYLSSKYLSPTEQSNLAFKCRYMEFSVGEAFVKHPQYGRGIMILKRGMTLGVGTVLDHGVNAPVDFRTYGIDDPIAVNVALVEDSYLENDGRMPMYRFVSYSVMIFIPQSVIYEVLSANKSAWKDCARWKYLQACLLKWARDKKAA